MALPCLSTLLSFKRWADQQTLAAIATIDDRQYAEQKKIMIRLMNHIYVVDAIFKGNLQGIDHGYQALNTVDTPTITDLSQAMDHCSEWYLSYVDQWSTPTHPILFTFVDGGQGSMSAVEMVEHILHHSSYHRGAVGWLISQAGGVAPKDVLSVFLRDHAQCSESNPY
ncbi:diguanylate cyclase [Rosenbergiella sp. S61]|uniref:Diguanylate cyclase n=1 Tax=Rosenbergiella gaditana TaxID=2726987 RepID=A0ABS5STZ0_9GAMM|nr:DinB family protein [Rosenbergiella gaditana]MBT0723381.1 diguanylate cyclase [Rosenbergiella gaditana]